MKRAARGLGAAVGLAGLILLGVSALGAWTPLGRYESFEPSDRRPDRIDMALVARTPDFESLYREAEREAGAPFAALPPERVMQALYDVVARRFTHGDKTVYGVFTNWTMLVAGLWDPTYRIIHVPDVLLRLGHTAICDQLAYLLQRLSARAGVPARIVVLHGHVVMEARYGGGWHMYDPDVELVPRGANGEVLSVEALENDAALVRSLYAPLLGAAWAEDVVEDFTSKENNTYWDEAAPREWLREEHAQPLKFIVPVFLAVFGFGALRAFAPSKLLAPYART